MSEDTIVLRELSGIAEMQRSEAFQIEAWGEGEKPDNSDILMALQSEGGLVAGAFRGDDMLGFLLGFPSATPGVQHSHRLAVKPGLRGLGLGAKLKWFQRDWCLARGVTKVRWTYDPLRAINAGLNIGTLGAVVNEYFVNYYGDMPASMRVSRPIASWLSGTLRASKLSTASKQTLLSPPWVNLSRDWKFRTISTNSSQPPRTKPCANASGCETPCNRPSPQGSPS